MEYILPYPSHFCLFSRSVCFFLQPVKKQVTTVSALLNSGRTISFCLQPVVHLDKCRLTHVCQLDYTCDLVALQPILEVFTSHPAPSISVSVLCVCLSFQVHMRDFCVFWDWASKTILCNIFELNCPMLKTNSDSIGWLFQLSLYCSQWKCIP